VNVYEWATVIIAVATFMVTALTVKEKALRKNLFILSCAMVAAAVAFLIITTVKDSAYRSNPAHISTGQTTAATAAIMKGPWQGTLSFDHAQFGLRLIIESTPEGHLTAQLTIFAQSAAFIPSGTVAMTGDCTTTSVSLTFNHWLGRSAGHGLIQLYGTPPPEQAGTFSGTLDFLVIHTRFSVHKI
jgi:hypothetical protein